MKQRGEFAFWGASSGNDALPRDAFAGGIRATKRASARGVKNLRGVSADRYSGITTNRNPT